MADKEKPQNSGSKKVFTRKDEDLQLKERLLLGPELFINERGSDQHLDKLSLLIKLQSGKEFTLKDYISENLIPYRSRFYKEYYYEIARLYGLPKEIMDRYDKPDCAAMFTVQFIYGRFPMKVLNELRKKSPWTTIPRVRDNKLFQYLSVIASEQLDLYIDQAVQTMKTCDTLSDFKLKYSKQYRIYFQLDMFTDVVIIP